MFCDSTKRDDKGAKKSDERTDAVDEVGNANGHEGIGSEAEVEATEVFTLPQKDVAARALDMLNTRKATDDDFVDEVVCEESGRRELDEVSVTSILEDVSKRSKKFALMTPAQLAAMGSSTTRGKDPYQKHMLSESEDLLARSLYHTAWDEVLKQLVRNKKSGKRELLVHQLNDLYGRGILEDAELSKCVDEISLCGPSDNLTNVASRSPRAKLMGQKGKDLLTTFQIVPREIRWILQSTEELRWVQHNTRKSIVKRMFTELRFEEVKKIYDWAQGKGTNLTVYKVRTILLACALKVAYWMFNDFVAIRNVCACKRSTKRRGWRNHWKAIVFV